MRSTAAGFILASLAVSALTAQDHIRKEQYKDMYRDGFRSGYDDGYRDRGTNRPDGDRHR